jgi:GNAT superfamily N-acetyltransferase
VSVLMRPAVAADHDAVWAILEPVIRAGETWALPRDMTRDEALTFWHDAKHPIVAELDGRVVGTYFIRTNQMGGGRHVANAGYMTATDAQGRGVARAMVADSLERARALGYRAMQFNFVVSTNDRAVRTWLAAGFVIAGTLAGAFEHPTLGEVDVYVMYQRL